MDTPDSLGVGRAVVQATATPASPAGSSSLLRNVAASVIFGVALLALVWFFNQGGQTASASQAVTLTAKASGPAPRVGQPAPEFRVAGLDGNPIELSALRGHPVWVNFWASWCPPCRAEAPEIDAAAKQYAAQGLVVVAIDVGEDAATVRDYVQRAGIGYPVAGDPGTEVAATYRVTGLPTHIFIDADGIVRDIRMGRLGSATIDQEMARLLGK